MAGPDHLGRTWKNFVWEMSLFLCRPAREVEDWHNPPAACRASCAGEAPTPMELLQLAVILGEIRKNSNPPNLTDPPNLTRSEVAQAQQMLASGPASCAVVSPASPFAPALQLGCTPCDPLNHWNKRASRMRKANHASNPAMQCFTSAGFARLSS